jgi:hypothetical protein
MRQNYIKNALIRIGVINYTFPQLSLLSHSVKSKNQTERNF